MILKTVIPVFLIILVSYIIARYIKINTEPFVTLIMYITAPCLVFYTTALAEFVLNDFFSIIASAAMVVLGSGLVAYFIFRALKLKFKGFYLPIMFMNAGYMGYPITILAFGVEGLSKAVVYNIVTTILVFTLGIYLASKKSNLTEVLKQPVTYALLVGLIISFFRIGLPDILVNPVKLVGDVTIPLSLIVLGFTLATIKIKSYKYAVVGSLIRFLSGFLIALSVVTLLGIEGVARNVILVISVMPSAFMSFVISKQYKSDADMVASTVLLSTVLSMVVIPLVLYIL